MKPFGGLTTKEERIPLRDELTTEVGLGRCDFFDERTDVLSEI